MILNQTFEVLVYENNAEIKLSIRKGIEIMGDKFTASNI